MAGDAGYSTAATSTVAPDYWLFDWHSRGFSVGKFRDSAIYSPAFWQFYPSGNSGQRDCDPAYWILDHAISIAMYDGFTNRA